MSLPFGLKFKNTLGVHQKFNSVISKITEIIKEVPNHQDLKNDPELLLLICNLVENFFYTRNKNKIDKRDIVICILDDLYNITDEEKTVYEQQIQFLHNNNQIKKQPLHQIIGHYIIDWLNRRFL
jgi:hypothetical protein